jgi:hypothetical protein
MPPPNDTPDRTTSAISALTDRLIAYRVLRGKVEMDRLSEKLANAAGAAGRLSAKIEARADALIAREAAIEKRTDQVFSAPEALMDEAETGLTAIEKNLALMSNNPPPASTAPPQAQQSTPLPPAAPISRPIGS